MISHVFQFTKNDNNALTCININKGNPRGHPDGTDNEKIFKKCRDLKMVAPTTIIKLMEKVNIKWDVGAKLYGTIVTRLFTNININKDDINNKHQAWAVKLSCLPSNW
jgi:hypothetical protein